MSLGWVVFAVVVVSALVIDLGILNRRTHEIKIKEALLFSGMWVAIALCFNAGVFFFRGHDAAVKFLTGYLLEESLSVDNLFVFILIFGYFQVPSAQQRRVLFWGILGAVIMRALFIGAGVTLIHRFHWISYLFGAFLVFTGFKLAFGEDKEVDPSKNPIIRIFRKCMPVTDHYEGGKFFLKKEGRLFATPLLIVLLVVETTDVLFAVDSIPAILGITTDPFVVYTSNVFAILGLRSLYFALAGIMRLFHYLNYGLALVLIFVGIKMVVADFFKIPVTVALGVIGGILGTTILISLVKPPPCKDQKGNSRSS